LGREEGSHRGTEGTEKGNYETREGREREQGMKTVEDVDAAWDELRKKGNLFLYGAIDVQGILNIHPGAGIEKALHLKEMKLSELLEEGMRKLGGD
jgi:hypothetical protein